MMQIHTSSGCGACMTLPTPELSWDAFTVPSQSSTLPIDRSRSFDPADYPAEPSAYTPLDHFVQRFKEPERFLTDEVVRRTIREGDLRDNSDGCGCFRKPWPNGVAYYLVVGYHHDGYRIIITGWPWVHDRETALDTGEWTTTELDTIKKLNDRNHTYFADQWQEYVKWSKQHPEGNVTT